MWYIRTRVRIIYSYVMKHDSRNLTEMTQLTDVKKRLKVAKGTA